MKNLTRISYLPPFFVLLFFVAAFAANGFAQDRPRVARTVSSQPTNPPLTARPTTTTARPQTSSLSSSRPVLTNEITVAESKPLVKKIVAAAPAGAAMLAAGRTVYSNATSISILQGIQSRLGIPYRYGSSGPNTYDCSGFIWAVFRDAGIHFERQSARSLWAASEPVEGDERFKFGTLVFLNRLGHVGIVADENGFYHASSSKGITYSPFKGYWEKRIVGFRRLAATPASLPKLADDTEFEAQ